MLRQDLVKNFCCISEPDLYNGTKRLIEKYHNEVIKCILLIYSCPISKLSMQQKLTFFAETRHSFGHTALMLSGGASFGKFHYGVIDALLENDIMPRTVCGSSIGSLILGIMCVRPYSEARNFMKDPTEVFSMPTVRYKGENLWQRIKMTLRGQSIVCTETM